DLQGTQQSGNLDLKIADISKDNKLLSYCRELAGQVLDSDPELALQEHASLKEKLDIIKERQMNWGRIS
ncbi:MAG: hypothetical protein WED33_09855, partial [Bacteroidia bacterium]